jgi:hypothetical protein
LGSRLRNRSIALLSSCGPDGMALLYGFFQTDRKKVQPTSTHISERLRWESKAAPKEEKR